MTHYKTTFYLKNNSFLRERTSYLRVDMLVERMNVIVHTNVKQ
jgi:hypothetical protein